MSCCLACQVYKMGSDIRLSVLCFTQKILYIILFHFVPLTLFYPGNLLFDFLV